MLIERVFASVLAMGFLLASSPATSLETIGGPTTGLWAHAGDGGRGFNIDIQDGTMIVTTFIYTTTGAPIWYLSSGTYNHATGVFTSSYDSYSDGQCFGCAATPPVVHSGAAGPMRIQFHDNHSATLTTPAGSLEITKFDYGFGSQNDRLFGYWVFSFDVAGLVNGDYVIFNDTFVDSGGTLYVAGYSDDALHRPALGRYVPNLDIFVVATQSSTSFVHDYQLSLDDHRAFGFAWVIPSGQSPTGNGSPAFAGRLLFRSELANLAMKHDSVNARALDDFNRLLHAQVEPSSKVSSGADVLEPMHKALAEYASSRH